MRHAWILRLRNPPGPTESHWPETQAVHHSLALSSSRARRRHRTTTETALPSGETLPVSCPFKCPRMPADARLFPGQLLAVLRNTLRDNRFVLAAAKVS